MYIIIYPKNNTTAYGPFDSEQSAIAWAKGALLLSGWCVRQLVSVRN